MAPSFSLDTLIILLVFSTTLCVVRLLWKKCQSVLRNAIDILKKDPVGWLVHVPVNPLVIYFTRAEFFSEHTSFHPNKKYLSYALVLRYKEILWWVAVSGSILLFLHAPIEQALVGSAVLLVGALRSIEWYMLHTEKERLRVAERELPPIIDLLRLFVSAGQNLELALRNVATPANGWWGIFFSRLVGQLEAGKNFEQTLSDSARQLPSGDYHRFVAALKQAQLLGVPLSTTLGVQASLLRARRRQQAEGRAHQASVKIALPLALCIFPALLIMYLTPALLRLFNDV